MKAFKKGLTTVLSIMLIGSSLVACGTKAAETPKNDEPSTNTPPAEQKDAPKNVEITWWNFPSFQPLDGETGKYEKQIIEAFNKQHPEIKVNLEMLTYEAGPEKLNVAIASNTAPDVIYDAPGRILDWGKKDLLAPLDDMITDEIRNDISPALWKQSMVGDTTYMYPINTAPFMMGVNKTIFEEIGAIDLLPLDRPDRTWTVEEYEKALQAVKEKAPDIIPSGFFAKSQAGDQGTRAYLANLGNSRFFTEDYSQVAINTDKAGAALDWIVKGVKDKLIISGSESLTAADVNDLFLQGKLAFSINYSPVLRAQNDPLKKAPFEDVLLPFPTIDGAKPQLEPYLGGMAVFNNGDEDKIAASKKLVDFIANDPEWGNKNLIQTGGLSARNSITGLYDDPEYTYSEQAREFYTDPPTIVDGWAEVRTFWFPELQRALLNVVPGKEALDTFAKNANEAIAKAKADAGK